MVFSSAAFIFCFFPIVLLIYWMIKPIIFKNLWLLVVSIIFYYIGAKDFTIVLLACIVVNYLLALLIDKNRSKRIMCRIMLYMALSYNMLLLCYYKYGNVIFSIFFSAAEKANASDLVLPIGISFFTFQAISYIIDVYRGEAALKNPMNLGLYLSFFPQLIAGPIVRYNDISKQLFERNKNKGNVSNGLCGFVVGLTKKVIIANTLGELADLIFSYNDYAQISILSLWLGAIAYTLQIYFDFSGYSDMAVNLGKIFGFTFKGNFDYPYASRTMTEFWRRWHISLSGWFKDYVYIPLGGSHCSMGKHIRNFIIVWILTGMWHGANWTYILWGCINALFLLLEKYFIQPFSWNKNWKKIIYRFIVGVEIICCWVIFRSYSVGKSMEFIGGMFGIFGNKLFDKAAWFQLKNYIVYLVIGGVLSFPLTESIKRPIVNLCAEKGMSIIADIGLVVLFIMSLAHIIMGGYNPFLYYMF